MRVASPLVVRWSTGDVAPARRFEYYAAALASALTPMRVSGDPRAPFSTDMSMVDLGLISLLRQHGTPHRAYQSPLEVGRNPSRTFHLIVNITASWKLEHRERLRLAPGDAVLVDSELPADLEMEAAYDVVHVKLEEAWLRRWVPSPAVLVGRRICGEKGWGRALASFAAQLSPQGVLDSPLPTSVIADHIGALIALIASETTGQVATASAPAAAGLRELIHDCIVQRCAELDFTASLAAASVGISVRSLHRVLAAAGETFGGLLMGARTQLAVRMLESPLMRRLTAAEVGRRAGFVDPSHFSRVLRSRTGRTPQQIRRDAHGASADP